MAQYDPQYSHLLPSHLLMGQSYPQPPSTIVSPIIPQHQFYQPFPQTPSSPINFSPNGPGLDYNSVMAATAQYNVSPYYHSPMTDQLDAAGQISRTVYLGNLSDDTTAEKILDHVHSGIVESVKLFAEKNCAFISFLNHACASHFYSDAILRKLSINSQDIKIGWGKPSPLSPMVALAVSQNNATRTVYIGNLPEDITKEQLSQDLSKFGPIDTINLIPEKNIGFVHFLSISTAMKVVQQFSFEDSPENLAYPNWAGRKVFYGKDRCAYISKTQQQNAAQYLGIAPGYEHLLATADRELISSALAQQSAAAVAVATAAGGPANVGNRTLYLGSVHPETTIEEICNVVRGGLLHNVRYIPEKHICFITFVDPTAAAQFYALATLQSLAIHNRRLKVGWGKHSGPLPQALAMAVAAGASRNVYIGNIAENWPESKLRHDFSEFGEIEQVNFLPEKTCAFVNFTNLANAIKAIDGIKEKKEYQKFKINFGKDRCANPSRQLQRTNPVPSPGSVPFQQHASPGQFYPSSEASAQYPSSAAAAVVLAAAAAAAMTPGGPLLSSAMGTANMAPNSPIQMNGNMSAANMFGGVNSLYQQPFPHQNMQMMELLRNNAHMGGLGVNTGLQFPVLGSSPPAAGGMMSMMSTLNGGSSRSSPGILSPIEEIYSPNLIPGFSGAGYRAPNFPNDTSTTITIPEEEEEEEEEAAKENKTDTSDEGRLSTAGDDKSQQQDLEEGLRKLRVGEPKEDVNKAAEEQSTLKLKDAALELPLSSDTKHDQNEAGKLDESKEYKVIDQATAAATAADVAQAFGL